MSEDYQAKLEKALKKKYGDDLLKPCELKEDFFEDLEIQEQRLYDKEYHNASARERFENRNGYLINKRLVRKEISNCPYCNRYKIHFTLEDDYKLSKYGCCDKCFDRHIEGREKRWLDGWRPNRE